MQDSPAFSFELISRCQPCLFLTNLPRRSPCKLFCLLSPTAISVFSLTGVCLLVWHSAATLLDCINLLDLYKRLYISRDSVINPVFGLHTYCLFAVKTIQEEIKDFSKKSCDLGYCSRVLLHPLQHNLARHGPSTPQLTTELLRED